MEKVTNNEYSCQNTLKKIMKKVRVTPGYEKMQADSSHQQQQLQQQQQQYQKVLLGHRSGRL